MTKNGHESPSTTSVWHRPLVPEEAKDRLAKRRANAAVALLRLGREQQVWPLLQHRPDPRTRSYLIHRIRPLEADPKNVLNQLDIQEDVSIRRALILTLGEFNHLQLLQTDREQLAPRLLDLYANDPDPGIHGASAWTLRQWGRQQDLQQTDRQLATGKADGSRGWYVNRQGQTLVIIPAPGEVMIGSPPFELGREDGPEGGSEMQRYVRIDAPFALATKQVTVAEFLRFRKTFYYRKYFSPEPDCPINNVSWYDAVAYCNWVNEQEGIPREQWCYLPNEQGEYAQGMTIIPDYGCRTGYRLPTEAEWEYACRAGAVTSRFYGQNLDLDNYYVCSVQNALGRRTALVASFKPNDLGLFDMLGNNLEWSQSVFRDPSQPTEDGPRKSPDLADVVRDQPMRALKSATPCHPPETMRNAYYEAYPTNANVLGTSLRVGRTCLPHEASPPVQQMQNDERLAVRGSGCFHCSEQMRICYRIGHRANFRLFAFGVRTARTMH
jgi:formylglycine-generating enzyme required for sulfatase activity